jgi:hypothetical protein
MRQTMSAATRGNRLIGVLHIGVKAAQIAVAFGSALAQRGYSARLDQFKEIKPRNVAYFGPVGASQAFEPRLQCCKPGCRIGEIAIAAWLDRFGARGGRGQERQDKCARNHQSHKSKTGQDEAFEHDMIPCGPPLVGPQREKVHVLRYLSTG